MSRTRAANARHGSPRDSAGACELSIGTRQDAAGTIVEVAGRMTIDSSSHLRPALHATVDADSPAGVLVDFSSVTYADSSAAATLIEAAMRARDRGVRLRVVGVRGQPRLLAEVIELDRIFRGLGSDVEFA